MNDSRSPPHTADLICDLLGGRSIAVPVQGHIGSRLSQGQGGSTADSSAVSAGDESAF
jgi:hypothetical protein